MVAAHYKKDYVTLLDKQFGYFRLPRGLSRRTRSTAVAWHGMCELTARHGMGAAWDGHGRGMGTTWTRHWYGMLCVNRPLEASLNISEGLSEILLSISPIIDQLAKQIRTENG